jgi:hypothetical protein
MNNLTEKIIRHFRPSIQQKSRRVKNEEDMINLFKQYFQLNRTSKDEVETFLRNNRISFNRNTSIASSADEILINLPGPAIWRDFLLPYSSHYEVQFHFTNNVLFNIKAILVEYHF